MKVAALFVVAVLLLAPSLVKSQQCSGTSSFNNYMVTWSVSAGVVQFKVSVPTNNGTWVALGFSTTASMINSDVVVGSISDGGDYFVEDRWVGSVRTVPTYDTTQSITGVSMENTDGTMRMIFSRPISLSNAQDLSLGDACVQMLAAWGGSVSTFSSPAAFNKHTNAGVITDMICLQDCTDGITSTSSNPAATSTAAMPSSSAPPLNPTTSNPVIPSNPTPASSTPLSASPSPLTPSSPQCIGTRNYNDYKLSWTAYAGVVQFEVSVPTDNGTWVAVGFSGSQSMFNSDVVIGSINNNGEYFVEDRWADNTRNRPSYDSTQDITDVSMENSDGTMKMKFSRPISVSLGEDLSLDGISCRYILAAWGGSVSGYSSPAIFSKHTNAGVIPQLICLQDCKDGITPTSSYPVATSTRTMSQTPSSTSESSGGGGLSTVYIIIIVVIGGLISIAVVLFLILVCVCICTKQTTKSTALYELDSSPVPHPAVRRETMSNESAVQNVRHTVTIPLNEYNEEMFQEQVMYDTVAPDSVQLPAAANRPDSFYDGTSDPAAIYDQVPEEKRTSHFYGQNEDTATTFKPQQPNDQYEQMNPAIPAAKQEPYEHMQYDPINLSN